MVLFLSVFPIFVLQMFYKIKALGKKPEKCLLKNSHIQVWQQ